MIELTGCELLCCESFRLFDRKWQGDAPDVNPVDKIQKSRIIFNIIIKIIFNIILIFSKSQTWCQFHQC